MIGEKVVTKPEAIFKPVAIPDKISSAEGTGGVVGFVIIGGGLSIFWLNLKNSLTFNWLPSSSTW